MRDGVLLRGIAVYVTEFLLEVGEVAAATGILHVDVAVVARPERVHVDVIGIAQDVPPRPVGGAIGRGDSVSDLVLTGSVRRTRMPFAAREYSPTRRMVR